TKFKPHSTFKTSNKNQQQLFHQLKKQIKTQNIFSPLKISPTFKKIHLPIIPPQQPPYTPLIHSPPTQPQQTPQNIKPSILRFFTPQLFHRIGS
ncbi:acetolactate decarboxylase, partial [Staphylococcus epidermidis]|uniref:acetolactate decarboxylase n=1 Tax=Staphylococcus epidermidis TaxID=1282 RepID=UPI0016425D9E